MFVGPGDQTFPAFLADFRAGAPKPRYVSTAGRTIEGLPPVRRDLIDRSRYLVPNSIVVTRGCPQHCDFCYKDAFFAGGAGFYTQRVDEALAEIERLPGRHLYFLDDHLLGNRRFAGALFDGMAGMGRLFQGAATVDSVLRGDLIEQAARAGLRSLFVGFESFSAENLRASNKKQNLARDYGEVTRRLSDLGIMINGSFVFGMDDDDADVFERTVDWAVRHGVTTATFHIMTPYPGTRLFERLAREGRITSRDWDRFDTRQVVYRPAKLTAEAGLRSLFVGFETLTPGNLERSNKRQNLGRDYKAVADRLHGLGIMINGSFVFGMDDDGEDVFRRTVDWAIKHGITTATFHVQTPYPGTALFRRMEADGRLTTRDWDRYDTRHVVFRPARLSARALEQGYEWAYREFYRWPSIARASLSHGSVKHQAKHFFYAAGWKKFERGWGVLIRARQLRRMTPLLEAVLSKVTRMRPSA